MGNKIHEESLGFSVDIIKFTKYLRNEKKEFVLANQLLKSGTSIGVNIAESQSAVSNKDFIQKLFLSLKEARETSYWLDLLEDAHVVDSEDLKELNLKLDYITGMLVKIINRCKQKPGFY